MIKLIYNVGVSDIKIYTREKYNEIILFRNENLYGISKFLYYCKKEEIIKEGINFSDAILNFNEDGFHKKKVFIERVRFEILESFLKYMKEKVSDYKIILFATEQEPQNSKDTYYVGKLIQYYLSYHNISNELIKIEFNPTDLNKLIKFYNNILNTSDIYYFNLTTGTPMQTLALALLCKKYHAICLYKPYDEEVKEVIF